MLASRRFASASRRTRIGLVGVNSSHADHLVRFVRERLLGPQVSLGAIATTREVDAPRARDLASQLPPDSVPAVLVAPLETVARDLARCCDALIVLDPRASHHPRVVRALAPSALPLFVDKPLARTPRQARDLLDHADHFGCLLVSGSALRWHPLTESLAARYRGQRGLVVSASGPLSADSSPAARAFYAVHAVELALAVAGAEAVRDITSLAAPSCRLVTLRAGGNLVTISTHLAQTETHPPAQTPFHLSVAGRDHRRDVELTLDDDYLLGAMDTFLDAATTAVPPLSHQAMVDSVRVTERLCRAIAPACSAIPNIG